MTKYDGTDAHGQPRATYLENLTRLSDAALEGEAKSRIWLSACAVNEPGADCHWQVDATYDECVRRNNIEIYRRAHASAGG